MKADVLQSTAEWEYLSTLVIRSSCKVNRLAHLLCLVMARCSSVLSSACYVVALAACRIQVNVLNKNPLLGASLESPRHKLGHLVHAAKQDD